MVATAHTVDFFLVNELMHFLLIAHDYPDAYSKRMEVRCPTRTVLEISY